MIAVRSNSMADLLLTGPAIRALAARAEVTLVCGPRGLDAALLLPCVTRVISAELPWIDPEPDPVANADTDTDWLVAEVGALGADQAVIFTSSNQRALPLALLLRTAGVCHIAAICDDDPGSLLDVRHRDPGDVHEVTRALSIAEAAGFPLPADDDAALCIHECGGPPTDVAALGRYAVVHPAASVPSEMWPAERSKVLVERLVLNGWNVVVTGAAADAALTSFVAGDRGVDLGGRLDLRVLAAVLANAEVLVAPNTGPAHLAAAVGTPVVSLCAPVPSAPRRRPWQVPHVMLHDQRMALGSVTVDLVMRAIELLPVHAREEAIA